MRENCGIEIKPYSLSGDEAKKSNPFSVSYIHQDYWSFKNRMLDYIRENRRKDFNDFSESSVVVMIAEMFAFLADTLSFKIDQWGNEIFVDTVTEPANMMRICKLTGFKPTPPTPSKAMFVGKITSPLDTDLVIQTPVKVTYGLPGVGTRTMELFAADNRNNPIVGESIIIPAGEMSSSSIVGIEGNTKSNAIESPGIPNYAMQVGYANVLKGSININVDNVSWQEVEYFTGPERQFTVQYNERYGAYVIFGDNENGLIPPKGSMIEISFREGGGTAGNITTGSVQTTSRIAVDGLPYMVVVEFTNYTKGEFGYDGDSIEDIRRKLPIYNKVQNRAVTGDDYRSIAELFSSPYNGSIGKATAALRHAGCAGNIIDLYVLAHSGQGLLSKPNDNLKEELAKYMDHKKMLTDFVCIRSGEIIYVDINIDIILPSIYRRSEDRIREKVSNRIVNFFDLSNWDFGKSLKESEIIRAITDIKEIEQIDIAFTTIEGLETGEGSTGLITAKFNEIIRPDNLTLYFNYR